MLGILPLGAGDHLLQTIKVLEPGKQRLLGQTGSARKQADAVGCVSVGIGSGKIALQDTAHRGAWVDAITALAVAAGEDQLEHCVAKSGGVSQDFIADQCVIRDQRKAPATVLKALQVAVEQHGLPGLDGDGFKQPITVRQAAIFQWHAVRWLTVDPAVHHSANRRNTREPLVPPNPKELEITTSIGIGWAS